MKGKGLKGDKKQSLQTLQESLKTAASEGGYSLELKTKGMKERDKKVVCKTFHGAGLVVPVDENEVGYRPVPETPGEGGCVWGFFLGGEAFFMIDKCIEDNKRNKYVSKNC